MTPPPKILNILLLGSPKSGKTSLIKTLQGEKFSENYEATIGNHNYKVNELNFIDTAGDPRFNLNISSSVILSIDIILVLIEGKNIDRYIKKQIIDIRVIKNCPYFIVNNKIDINDSIEGNFNISIKNGSGISEMLYKLKYVI